MQKIEPIKLLEYLAEQLNTKTHKQLKSLPQTAVFADFVYVEIMPDVRLYYFESDPDNFTISISGYDTNRLPANMNTINDIIAAIHDNPEPIIIGADPMEIALRDLVTALLKANKYLDIASTDNNITLWNIIDKKHGKEILNNIIADELTRIVPELEKHSEQFEIIREFQ